MEEETNPATEVESTDSDDSKVVIDQMQPEEEGDEPEDQSGEAADADFEEYEHDGERYSVPSKLKPLLMMNADYTRKTQEVAEQRKSVEAERENFAKEREQHIANQKSFAEVYALDQQLEQYRKLNWDEITENDPVQALKLQRQYENIKDLRNTSANKLSETLQKASLELQQKTAKQLEEGRQTLAREIKGWSPELELNLKSKGVEYGFTKEEMEVMHANPKAVKVLHKAYLYDQLMKQKAAQPTPQPPAKPITTVKTGKSTTVPSEFRSDMTDAQFDKWYEQKVKKKKA